MIILNTQGIVLKAVRYKENDVILKINDEDVENNIEKLIESINENENKELRILFNNLHSNKTSPIQIVAKTSVSGLSSFFIYN